MHAGYKFSFLHLLVFFLEVQKPGLFEFMSPAMMTMSSVRNTMVHVYYKFTS